MGERPHLAEVRDLADVLRVDWENIAKDVLRVDVNRLSVASDATDGVRLDAVHARRLHHEAVPRARGPRPVLVEHVRHHVLRAAGRGHKRRNVPALRGLAAAAKNRGIDDRGVNASKESLVELIPPVKYLKDNLQHMGKPDDQIKWLDVLKDEFKA